MEGSYEHVLGVFSTPELAVEELSDEMHFSDADQVSKWHWKYVFDGELTHHFEVIEIELDRGIHDY